MQQLTKNEQQKNGRNNETKRCQLSRKSETGPLDSKYISESIVNSRNGDKVALKFKKPFTS